nr:MAG TPA: hypothetical protein [Crassvirales sp.]
MLWLCSRYFTKRRTYKCISCFSIFLILMDSQPLLLVKVVVVF